jgi:hypothetical protein
MRISLSQILNSEKVAKAAMVVTVIVAIFIFIYLFRTIREGKKEVPRPPKGINYQAIKEQDSQLQKEALKTYAQELEEQKQLLKKRKEELEWQQSQLRSQLEENNQPAGQWNDMPPIKAQEPAIKSQEPAIRTQEPVMKTQEPDLNWDQKQFNIQIKEPKTNW